MRETHRCNLKHVMYSTMLIVEGSASVFIILLSALTASCPIEHFSVGVRAVKLICCIRTYLCVAYAVLHGELAATLVG